MKSMLTCRAHLTYRAIGAHQNPFAKVTKKRRSREMTVAISPFSFLSPPCGVPTATPLSHNPCAVSSASFRHRWQRRAHLLIAHPAPSLCPFAQQFAADRTYIIMIHLRQFLAATRTQPAPRLDVPAQVDRIVGAPFATEWLDACRLATVADHCRCPRM